LSDEVLFGLFAMDISVLAYVLIRLVRGVVVQSYTRAYPDRDPGRFRRFQESRRSDFSGPDFLTGLGFLIFGLAVGKVAGGCWTSPQSYWGWQLFSAC
jgi:hypothetical protein